MLVRKHLYSFLVAAFLPMALFAATLLLLAATGDGASDAVDDPAFSQPSGRALAAAGLLALGLTALALTLLVRRLRTVTERCVEDIAQNIPGLLYHCRQRPDGTLRAVYVAGGLAPLLHDPAEGTPAVSTPSDGESLAHALHHAAMSGTPLDFRSLRPTRDGGQRWLRFVATPKPLTDGGTAWSGVTLDMTDLHQTEIALHVSEERLRMAHDAAGIGIWDWDLPTGRTVLSGAMHRILGIAPGSMEMDFGRFADMMVHPDDRARMLAEAHRTAQHGGAIHVECRILRPDGAVRWVEWIGNSITDAQAKPRRALGIARDITEAKETAAALEQEMAGRKAVEDRLRVALAEVESAMAAKARFFAAASHDLRQPVQTLFLFVHALSERLQGHATASLVAVVQQTLVGMKTLIDTLLDIAKLDSGTTAPEMGDFPAVTLLQRLHAEYAPRMAGKGLRFRIVGCPHWIHSDPVLLGRILGNLLENALKYTQSGGVLIGGRRRGTSLRIEVWDSGVGIPPELQAEIFQEFVQIGCQHRDASHGLGLGLSIVQRLSRQLGHEVTLRSWPGRGSVFAVTVPLAEPPAASLPPPLMVAATRKSKPLAIVLEDEPGVAMGLGVLLDEWGYEVIDASRPEAALDKIARRHRWPGVILADYHLRDTRNGIDAIAEIRKFCNTPIPAIVLTSDTTDERAREVGRIGAHLMVKPVQPALLQSLLRRLAPPCSDRQSISPLVR